MENLMNAQIAKENKCNKGALVGQIIGLTIAIIVIVAVSIPITLQVIEDANISDPTTETVVSMIPMFLGLAALVITTAILAG